MASKEFTNIQTSNVQTESAKKLDAKSKRLAEILSDQSLLEKLSDAQPSKTFVRTNSVSELKSAEGKVTLANAPDVQIDTEEVLRRTRSNTSLSDIKITDLLLPDKSKKVGVKTADTAETKSSDKTSSSETKPDKKSENWRSKSSTKKSSTSKATDSETVSNPLVGLDTNKTPRTSDNDDVFVTAQAELSAILETISDSEVNSAEKQFQSLSLTANAALEAQRANEAREEQEKRDKQKEFEQQELAKQQAKLLRQQRAIEKKQKLAQAAVDKEQSSAIQLTQDELHQQLLLGTVTQDTLEQLDPEQELQLLRELEQINFDALLQDADARREFEDKIQTEYLIYQIDQAEIDRRANIQTGTSVDPIPDQQQANDLPTDLSVNQPTNDTLSQQPTDLSATDPLGQSQNDQTANDQALANQLAQEQLDAKTQADAQAETDRLQAEQDRIKTEQLRIDAENKRKIQTALNKALAADKIANDAKATLDAKITVVKTDQRVLQDKLTKAKQAAASAEEELQYQTIKVTNDLKADLLNQKLLEEEAEKLRVFAFTLQTQTRKQHVSKPLYTEPSVTTNTTTTTTGTTSTGCLTTSAGPTVTSVTNVTSTVSLSCNCSRQQHTR